MARSAGTAGSFPLVELDMISAWGGDLKQKCCKLQGSNGKGDIEYYNMKGDRKSKQKAGNSMWLSQ